MLYMENQAFLRTLGCMGLPGVDGVPKGGMQLPVDPNDPSAGVVNVSCGTGKYVCDKGPCSPPPSLSPKTSPEPIGLQSQSSLV